jgi:acyl carrier protein phosphodiesterase
MISDFVKGKKKFEYPPAIQDGINLHRMIDQFTDTHEATAEAKKIFRPHYRLYSGAFVDVVYDHFLATDENEFTEDGLYDFSQSVYDSLRERISWFPEPFALFFPHMQQHNWLFYYRNRWGIEKSMGGLVRRAAYLSEHETGFRLFEQHYQLLQDCYRHFWATMKPWAFDQFSQMAKTDPAT